MGFNLGRMLGGFPGIGNVAKLLSRPGDALKDPFGSLLPLAGDALMLGGIPGVGGPLAQFAKGAGKFAPFLGAMGGQQGGGFNANSLAALYNLSGIGQPRYPDNGMGDKALGYADQLGLAGTSLLNQTMQDFADPTEARRRDPTAPWQDYLGGAGMDFLRQGQNLPGLQSMGALGNMQGIMGQMASQAGVANPFTGEGGDSNPYALRPWEQQQYNQQANMAGQGERGAIGSLRQQLASRGITDPRVRQIAEANIRANRTNNLMGTQSNLANQAFQSRQQTLGQFSQMMPQLYGAQSQRQQQNIGQGMNFLNFGNQLGQQGLDNRYRQLGAAGNFLNSPMNAYENAAQRAIGTNRDAGQERGQTVSNLLSGFFGQQNPFGNIFGQQGQQRQPQYTPPFNPDPTQGGYYPQPTTNVGTAGQDYTPLDQNGQPDYLSQFNQGWRTF